MKKIAKIFTLILLVLSMVSLVSCSEAEIDKTEDAHNKFGQVRQHVASEFYYYEITSAACYEYEGYYLYLISMERTVDSYYLDYYKTTYVLIESNGSLQCLTCGNDELSNLYLEYRDYGTYINIDLNYIPEKTPVEDDSNWFDNFEFPNLFDWFDDIELPDFIEEIIDWFENL